MKSDIRTQRDGLDRNLDPESDVMDIAFKGRRARFNRDIPSLNSAPDARARLETAVLRPAVHGLGLPEVRKNHRKRVEQGRRTGGNKNRRTRRPRRPADRISPTRLGDDGPDKRRHSGVVSVFAVDETEIPVSIVKHHTLEESFFTEVSDAVGSDDFPYGDGAVAVRVKGFIEFGKPARRTDVDANL